jgi:hypothetical protein
VSATTLLQAEALVGRRIRVHWVKEKAWYPALVDDYDATKAKGKHHVRYDDVDQWGKLNLTKMVFEVTTRDKRPFEFLDDDGEPPARLLKPSASQSTAGADIVALGKKPPPGQAVSVRRSTFLRHLCSRQRRWKAVGFMRDTESQRNGNSWLRSVEFVGGVEFCGQAAAAAAASDTVEKPKKPVGGKAKAAAKGKSGVTEKAAPKAAEKAAPKAAEKAAPKAASLKRSASAARLTDERPATADPDRGAALAQVRE